MENNWVIVHTVTKEYEAEIIKSLLSENNIECVILNKKDSVYLFGEIEIYVDVENAFIAKQFILNLESE
jgi:hypothetical protein